MKYKIFVIMIFYNVWISGSNRRFEAYPHITIYDPFHRSINRIKLRYIYIFFTDVPILLKFELIKRTEKLWSKFLGKSLCIYTKIYIDKNIYIKNVA